MFRRLALYLTRHPQVTDAAIALALAAFVVPDTLARFPLSDWWAGAFLSLLFLVPLVWRRTRPDAAALGIVAAHVMQLGLLPTDILLGQLTVPMVIYAVAAFGTPARSRYWLAFGLVCAGVGAWAWTMPPESALLTFALLWGGGSAVVMAAWFMGELARQRALSILALESRAAALERQRDQATALAVVHERQRIAREMHDVVAHSLSVIVVQADGAAYTMRHATGPGRDETVARAVATIRATAASALAETRQLVGVLHTDEPLALSPTTTLNDLDDLVAVLRDSGVAVTLEIVGDPSSHPPLGPTEELSAYRVVQEALTNVVKHAGKGAGAQIVLTHDPGGLTVSVSDDGQGSSGGDGRGHGLVGMRERISAHRGTLVAQNRTGGGFEVVAHLPAPSVEKRAAGPVRERTS